MNAVDFRFHGSLHTPPPKPVIPDREMGMVTHAAQAMVTSAVCGAVRETATICYKYPEVRIAQVVRQNDDLSEVTKRLISSTSVSNSIRSLVRPVTRMIPMPNLDVEEFVKESEDTQCKEMQELGDVHYLGVYWSNLEAYRKAIAPLECVENLYPLEKGVFPGSRELRDLKKGAEKGVAKLDSETAEKLKAFLDDFNSDPLVQRMLASIKF